MTSEGSTNLTNIDQLSSKIGMFTNSAISVVKIALGVEEGKMKTLGTVLLEGAKASGE